MKTVTSVPIPGYEGLYHVTTDGIVYNTKRGKPLKARPKKIRGHISCYAVVLSKNNKRKEMSISKIMKKCFFGNRDGVLMHKDMCKSNFSLQNLVLTTQSVVSARNEGCRRRSVVHRKPDGTEDVYKSTAAAAKALYISGSSISRICRGNHKSAVIEGEIFYEE